MMRGPTTGAAAYLTGLLLTFYLLVIACGGRGPSCPKPRAAGDSYDSRPVTCEVRR